MIDRSPGTSVTGAGIFALALLIAVIAHYPVSFPLAADAQVVPTATVTFPIAGDDVVNFSVLASPVSEATPDATPVAASATPRREPFAEVDALLDPEQGIYGVMIVDPNGNLRYSRNSDVPFISASLYKLLLVADILSRIEQEEISPEQELTLSESYFPTDSTFPDGFYGVDDMGNAITVNEALWATICVSSNVSAHALLTLTTAGSMNQVALDLGMKNTHFDAELTGLPNWPPVSRGAGSDSQLGQAVSLIEAESLLWQINLTTPADMAIFFDLLLEGEVISENVSEQLLTLLFDQQITDRIPALLPEEIAVANKTGNLESIVHDAGVIMTENGPVILVVMSEGVPDEQHTTLVIEQIAALVFDELD